MKRHIGKVEKSFLIIFILIVALSQFFVISEANHDCIGEECQICKITQTIEENLNRYMPKISSCVAIGVMIFTIVAVLGKICRSLLGLSLINLKVKLTD